MFKNVLVGVDGRANSRDAIALASQLVAPDGKLTLAHVRRDEAAEREHSHKLLEEERIGAAVKAELISLVSTSPGRGLHQQAKELGADLLVVGSCSHGVLGRVLLGDDSRAALDGAPCTVAIAFQGYAGHVQPDSQSASDQEGSRQSDAAG